MLIHTRCGESGATVVAIEQIALMYGLFSCKNQGKVCQSGKRQQITSNYITSSTKVYDDMLHMTSSAWFWLVPALYSREWWALNALIRKIALYHLSACVGCEAK